MVNLKSVSCNKLVPCTVVWHYGKVQQANEEEKMLFHPELKVKIIV